MLTYSRRRPEARPAKCPLRWLGGDAGQRLIGVGGGAVHWAN